MKIYAIVGTSQQTIIADSVQYNPQENEVLMQSERPADGDYIATAEGEWVVDISKKYEELDAQYDADKAELIKYFNEAQFINDTELISELRAEMEELDAQYVEDRKAIEEGSAE